MSIATLERVALKFGSICHDFATVRLRVIRFIASKVTSLAAMIDFYAE